MEILTLSDYLKKTFGSKVYKLSLSSGCTCPNRDGTIGRGGCTFCSEGGSGDFAAPFLPVKEQIRLAREKVDGKFPSGIAPEERKYIAYFQSFTNTYGDPDRLRKLYEEAIKQPEIAALSIGTRPDCLVVTDSSPEALAGKIDQDKILEMLEDLNRVKPVWVELGLQTIHEKTAEKIHRGYKLETFEKAYRELKARNLAVIVHLILGLPGETGEDMLESVRYLSRLSPALDGIKLQLLHVLQGTELAEEYRKDHFPVMTMEQYTDLVVECLKLLPRETVIHRMTGDGPRSILIEPKWSTDKKRVLNILKKKIAEA